MESINCTKKYQGVKIKFHSFEVTSDFWKMQYDETITGTPLTKLWIHHIEKTNILGEETLTANVTLILRNQSDLSNVIIILTTCSVVSNSYDLSNERILLMLTEFLFENAISYANISQLKGADQKKFVVPQFNYSDEFFKKEIVQ